MSWATLTRGVTWQAALAAFAVYSCMYAFRKPYTAATYEGIMWWGLPYKVGLVVAQTSGYALSKFYGIRFIGALEPSRRKELIWVLIGVSWLALLGFALSAYSSVGVFFLFINGLPLGLVFGVVFSYLEGRRSTEFLGAWLASSFVFSSGAVKSIGKWLMMEWEIGAEWMPFVAGSLFVLPIFLFSEWLDRTPEPDGDDLKARMRRLPMGAVERQAFLRHLGWGVVLLVAVYVMLTLLRDIRENFAAEIWSEFGYGQNAAVFTQTELPVTLSVFVLMTLLVGVRDNRRALWLNHVFIGCGLLLAAGATLAFQKNLIGPVAWFTATGLGLYLGYLPFNGLLFDRLLSVFKGSGNVGFVMYIADAFGYLGSVSVLLIKEFASVNWSWNVFLQQGLLFTAFLGSALMGSAWFFFKNRVG